MRKINKLVCNLIGTIEVLEVAFEKNDQPAFYQALAKAGNLVDEIKKHEHINRENGVYYD